MKITYLVKRGQAVGTVLTPHKHADGCFVVSKTRFSKDYTRLSDESEIPGWIKKGFSVRMSNHDVPSCRAPSLIAPSAIDVDDSK